MRQSALFKKPPSWMTFVHSRRWSRSEALNSWLKEESSLTQRLRKTWSDVSVRVLLENKQRPFINERQCLPMSSHHYALVREIILHSDDKPLILARTIIPPTAFNVAKGNLTRLGNKPLGEILFSSKPLKRQLIAVSFIESTWWTNTLQTRYPILTPIWGRCTRYYLENEPIIVSEFFLPTLFESI